MGLTASADGYRILAENLPVQVWTALPDGKLDYVSEHTAQSFGVSAETLLRDGWQDVLHPDDVPKAVERWTHALSTGDVYEVQFRLRLANGGYAWHLARAVPQRGQTNEIVRWLGTNTNIEAQREEQRRVEALLKEVANQAAESEAVILRLRRSLDDAQTRLRELEARLDKS